RKFTSQDVEACFRPIDDGREAASGAYEVAGPIVAMDDSASEAPPTALSEPLLPRVELRIAERRWILVCGPEARVPRARLGTRVAGADQGRVQPAEHPAGGHDLRPVIAVEVASFDERTNGYRRFPGGEGDCPFDC